MKVGRRLVGVVAMTLFLGATSAAQGDEAIPHSHVPKEGFVPDERTARLIAEAVLVPIYGRPLVDEQKPFAIRRSDGNWIASGKLKKGYVGGVATVVIDAKTGQILRVTHSR